MSERLISYLDRVLDPDASPEAAPEPFSGAERAIATRVDRLGARLRSLEDHATRLEADVRRRRGDYRRLGTGLRAVRKVSRLLLDTTDVDTVCARTVEILVRDLGADNTSILLLAPDRRSLRLAAAAGSADQALTAPERDAHFNRGLVIAVGEGVAGEVVRTGRPRHVVDVDREPAFKPLVGAVAVKSLYCFPLRNKSDVVGVLNVSHPHLETPRTNLRRLLSLLSSTIGQVITIARLHRRLIAQESERHAKLAQIGEMSASVAHEIRNPLTNILLRAQRLGRNPADPAKVARLAGDIERESHRITRIVTRLLDLGGEGDEVPTTASVHEIIEDTLVLTEHHLRSTRGVLVQRAFSAGLPAVKVVRRELEQVFTNLITNAARAMPDGGTLTIATRPTDHDGSGTGLSVAFTDSGHGIAPEHLSEIFRPFFTTGRQQGGTGLGLGITREIVERQGGTIRAESTPGHGATFTVVLPAAAS